MIPLCGKPRNLVNARSPETNSSSHIWYNHCMGGQLDSRVSIRRCDALMILLIPSFVSPATIYG